MVNFLQYVLLFSLHLILGILSYPESLLVPSAPLLGCCVFPAGFLVAGTGCLGALGPVVTLGGGSVPVLLSSGGTAEVEARVKEWVIYFITFQCIYSLVTLTCHTCSHVVPHGHVVRTGTGELWRLLIDQRGREAQILTATILNATSSAPVCAYRGEMCNKH